jgi:alkylation response protein AidB-like acyl-CoA dehydrogenase
MDLGFTAEQEELRASARSFLARQCPIHVVRDVVDSGASTTSLWQEMVALDWPVIAVPAEYGGVGQGIVELSLLVFEAGSFLAPVPFVPTAAEFATTVLALGSKQQKESLLPSLGSGVTGALAWADHPQGWDLTHLSATASPSHRGWVLAGTKHLVPAGVDLVAVVAQTGDLPGVFVAPLADLATEPVPSLDPTQPFVRVVLDGTSVAPEMALGEPGSQSATGDFDRLLNTVTLMRAVEATGTLHALFGLVVDYVKQRHQFGVPIGSFQAVKHRLADAFVSLERAQALIRYAIAAIEEGNSQQALAVSMAKAAVDDCTRVVCREAIQLHGGIAFTWEHDAHLFVKRAMTSSALYGGARHHRPKVARALVAPS